MNLYGPHIQIPGSGLDLLKRWQPKTVLLMDVTGNFINQVRQQCPNTIIVYRRYEAGARFQDWTPQAWVNRLLANVKSSLPDYIVTMNEPFGHDQAGLFAPFDAWQAEVIRLLQAAGTDGLANCFGTGNFTGYEGRVRIPDAFPLTCKIANVMGPHDYSWPTLEAGWGWYAGRWFQWYEDILAATGKKMKFIIGECGLTQAIIAGRPDEGWRSGADGVTDASYLDSLRWYNNRLCQWDKGQGIVLGATIFNFYDQYHWTFEHIGKDNVVNTIIAMDSPVLPEPPTPEPEPKPPNDGGKNMLDGIRVWKWDDPNNRQVEIFSQEAENLVFKKYGMAFRRAAQIVGQKAYRLVELREKRGPASLVVKVLDTKGQPLNLVGVAFWWTGAPQPPEPDTTVRAHDWYPNFVHGATNVNGDVGFGLGKGAYQGEGQGGPHATWVRDVNFPSDICEKLGMLAGTPHDHLEPTFQRWVEAGEEPEPGPEPEPEPEPEPPPLPAGWSISIQRGPAPGLRLFVGIFPRAGIEGVVVSPWGREEKFMSGSKSEYGVGGFEVPIWAAGRYTVKFLVQGFEVEINNNEMVKATFIETGDIPTQAQLISQCMSMADAEKALSRLGDLAGLFQIVYTQRL